MLDDNSVYSFTTYNTTHYSDSSNRLHQKVNSYAIEINQKIRDDNESLNDMEEGIIALSNYLNGVEDKRPSVTELIGSRINLDDCLKLKLEIREKIRKTKKIRTDLFTSVEIPSGNIKTKSEITPRLTPQTSRICTPNELDSRKSGQLSDGETDSKFVLKPRQPKQKPIELSKSLSKLPPSSLNNSMKAPQVIVPSSTTSSTAPQPTTSTPITSLESSSPPPPIRQLITPLIPSTTQRTQKSLMPVDDLADRQLAWLLNIEAKNRQAKHAFEAQTIREVLWIQCILLILSLTLSQLSQLKVAPDISKAQNSWIKVKKIYKKKYGIEVSLSLDLPHAMSCQCILIPILR
jgi:hypothetical protein